MEFKLFDSELKVMDILWKEGDTSAKEIAEKLNLPLGTIKSRIFFPRQKLQEELKDFR